jgi:hypothetical protein
MKNARTNLMKSRFNPILRTLGLCLFMAFAMACQSQAQNENAEKIEIGIRLNKAEVVTVYGGKPGTEGTEPDLNNPFTLHSDYYIIQSQDTFPKEPDTQEERYVMIYLPGPAPTNDQVQKMSVAVCAPGQHRGLTSLDWNQTFWIKVKELDKNPKSYRFAPEYRYSRWSVGVLAVPFKYRFASNGLKRQFGAESSLGLSVSYDLKRSRDFDERFSAIFGAGFTAINPNSAFAEDSTTKLKNIPGFSVAVGFVGYIKKVQIGAICGFDFADSDWAFDGKPWLALSVGYAFVTPQAAGKGNK